MTTLTTPTTTGPVAARTRIAGRWCLVAGLLGAAQAAIVLGWPEQVADDRYSYPFTAGWYVAAQASFAVQHLPLAVGVLALAGTAPARASRTTRVALLAAVVGLALLAVTEVVAMAALHAAEDSARGDLVSGSYGVPVLLTGLGLLVAGVAMLRLRTTLQHAPLLPWLVLALGGYVFFPLTPAISGSFTAGRLGIGGWMLGFALLGLALTRSGAVRR